MVIAVEGQLYENLPLYSAGVCGQDINALGQEDGFFHIMGNHENADSGALPQVQHKLLHGFLGLHVQGTEGFIHQHNLGTGSQGTGNGNSLLHSPGEFLGQRPGKFCQPHHVQKVRRHLPPFPWGNALQFQAKFHIFLYRHPGIQGVALEHHAPVCSRSGDSLAIHGNSPGRRGIQPSYQPQQSGFTRTRSTDGTNELAGFHMEVDVLEGNDRTLAGFELFVEVVNF